MRSVALLYCSEWFPSRCPVCRYLRSEYAKADQVVGDDDADRITGLADVNDDVDCPPEGQARRHLLLANTSASSRSGIPTDCPRLETPWVGIPSGNVSLHALRPLVALKAAVSQASRPGDSA